MLVEEMERIVVIEGYYWVYIGYRRCAYTHVLCPSHNAAIASGSAKGQSKTHLAT